MIPTTLFDTLGRYYAPQAPTASPVPAPSAVTEEIPAVPGLDTQEGLARVGGNRVLYVKLLRELLDLEPVPQQIAAALAGGDLDRAERLAHTIKGVAGNLGAGAVYESAGRLELALANGGDAAALEPRLAAFRTALAELVGPLRAALAQPLAATPSTPTVPLDGRRATEVVAEMLALLDRLDPAARELFEVHRDLFGALLSPADLSSFGARIASFSFAEALSVLRQAVPDPEAPLP